jgi:hypothetical protein
MMPTPQLGDGDMIEVCTVIQRNGDENMFALTFNHINITMNKLESMFNNLYNRFDMFEKRFINRLELYEERFNNQLEMFEKRFNDRLDMLLEKHLTNRCSDKLEESNLTFDGTEERFAPHLDVRLEVLAKEKSCKCAEKDEESRKRKFNETNDELL